MQRLVLVLLFMAIAATPAWGNFSEGQRRFTVGDYVGAYKLWMPLAEKGDARAQFSVGLLLEKGLGVEKNPDDAAGWYERAAEQGYEPAARALRALRPPAPPKPQAEAPPPAAQPQPLTERERVEAFVRALLTEADIQMRRGSLDYSDVSVAERDDGYDVQIYDLRVHGEGGVTIEVGSVSARVSEDGDRYYRICGALPSVMRGYDPNNDQHFEVHIGSQRNALVWDRELELTTDLDLTWENVSIARLAGPVLMRLASMAVQSDLREEGGRWSGPVQFRLAELELNEAGKGEVRLGEFVLEVTVERLDMARYAELSRRTKRGGKPDALMRSIKGLLNGFTVRLSLKDLSGAGGMTGAFQLANANYRLSFLELDQPYGGLAMHYSHGGLGGGRGVGALDDFAPHDAALVLKLHRIPFEEVAKAGVTAALEYMFLGEVSSTGAVLQSLRQALAQARTELQIEDGRFEAAKAMLTMAGLFAADAKAALGVSGELGITITSMDNILAAHQEAMGDGKSGGALGPFALVRMLAQMGQASADGKTRLYKIEVTRQGQVLLNGENVAQLMGGPRRN